MYFSVKNTNMQDGNKYIDRHRMYGTRAFLNSITFKGEIFDYEERII
jgi:hypothetical protein